jgi:hypothetical protein
MGAQHTPGLYQANGKQVIWDGQQHIAYARSDESARVIVEALNGQSELLDALVSAERQLVAAYGEPDGTPLSSKPAECAIKHVRAAIAKATGGAA